MGKRGPKPTPTVLKLARGNPGKRKLNMDEPELALEDAEAPADLKGEALLEWNRLAGELVAAGVLTTGDRALFKTYCELWGMKEQYRKLVRRVGLASADRLGYVNKLLKVQAQLKQYADDLGLSPSSRSGVKAVKPKDTKDERRKQFFGDSHQA